MNRFTDLVKTLLDASQAKHSRQQFLKLTGRTLALGATTKVLTSYGNAPLVGQRLIGGLGTMPADTVPIIKTSVAPSPDFPQS